VSTTWRNRCWAFRNESRRLNRAAHGSDEWAFEQQTGNRIALTTDVPVATKSKTDAGETFDVAILSPQLVGQLINEGKIVESAGQHPPLRRGKATPAGGAAAAEAG
jgi:hypothetical protein